MRANKEIQMIFVDLDGTLLQGTDTITPRTIRAFEKIRDAGITPVISTGRPAAEADFACRKIGADGYFITMNGMTVFEDYRSGKLLYEAHMDEKAANSIYQLLYEKRVFFQVYAGNRAYCQSDRAHLIRTAGIDAEHIPFYENHQYTVDSLPEYLTAQNLKIDKFLVSIGEPERNAALRSLIDDMPGVKTLASTRCFIEILPEGADKNRAVRAVRKAVGLEKSQVMVIGDSENDIGMFDEALTCVAMDNACEELKAKANHLAPSNYEDGVAWALEKLILGGK